MKSKACLALMSLLMLACTLAAHTAQSPINARMAAKPMQVMQTKSPVCIVTAIEALNLREGPGTAAAVIAILRYGDRLTILPDRAQGNWIHVRTLDRTGWINSNYCEAIK